LPVPASQQVRSTEAFRLQLRRVSCSEASFTGLCACVEGCVCEKCEGT
jgi:hypothetical protein